MVPTGGRCGHHRQSRRLKAHCHESSGQLLKLGGIDGIEGHPLGDVAHGEVEWRMEGMTHIPDATGRRYSLLGASSDERVTALVVPN